MKKSILMPIFFLLCLYGMIGQNELIEPKKTQVFMSPVIDYNFGSITLGNGRHRAIRDINLSNFNALGGGALVNLLSKITSFFKQDYYTIIVRLQIRSLFL